MRITKTFSLLFLFSSLSVFAETDQVIENETVDTVIPRAISIYLPSNLIPPSVLTEFTTQTGIIVEQRVYDIDLPEFISSRDYSAVDLSLLPYSYFPVQTELATHFKPITQGQLSNASLVKPELNQDELAPYYHYSAPLMIQGTGIAINAKMLPPSMLSHWIDFHDEQWTGQLLILDDAQTLISIALLGMGYPINNATDKQLEESKQWLIGMKGNAAFLSKKDPEMHFLSGQVSVGILSSNHAYIGSLEEAEIAIEWPSEGAILDIYALTINVNSDKEKDALLLINFLMSKTIQSQLTYHSGLTPVLSGLSTNSKRLQLLSAQTIEKGHFKLNSPESRQKYEQILLQVKKP
ncbi:ABC transporter substrate-binding protein [Vibrio inusitatus]|nr:extracellular solute-binding protein [Vibrio inusitatus]